MLRRNRGPHKALFAKVSYRKCEQCVEGALQRTFSASSSLVKLA